jgi:hypothetical protein
MRLAKLFQNSGGAKQGAWTVREAAFLGASDLVSVCPVEPLRHHQVLSGLLSDATSALQDRKFWRVRVAGTGSNAIPHL